MTSAPLRARVISGLIALGVAVSGAAEERKS